MQPLQKNWPFQQSLQTKSEKENQQRCRQLYDKNNGHGTNDQLVSITVSPQRGRAANIRTLPDTGAEIDAIPATVYCKFFTSVALKNGSQPYTATGNPITSLGTFQATISWLPDGAPVSTTVHVLRDLQQPVLSKSTQLAIGMLPKGYPHQRVNQVSTTATRTPPPPHNKPASCFPHVQTRHIPTVVTVVTASTPAKRVRMEHDLNQLKAEFPKIFDGTCQPMKGPPCHFQLMEGATPIAMRGTRPVSVPLMPRLKIELDTSVVTIHHPKND